MYWHLFVSLHHSFGQGIVVIYARAFLLFMSFSMDISVCVLLWFWISLMFGYPAAIIIIWDWHNYYVCWEGKAYGTFDLLQQLIVTMRIGITINIFFVEKSLVIFSTVLCN